MSDYHQGLRDALAARVETSFPDMYEFSANWLYRFPVKRMLTTHNLIWRQNGNTFKISVRNKEQAYAWIDFLVWADRLRFKLKFAA